MAHMSQSLFPCWSLVEQARREYGADIGCGLYLDHDQLEVSEGWSSDIIHAMGFKVATKKDHGRSPLFKSERSLVVRIPPKHGNNWFDHPEDATALRRQVLLATSQATTEYGSTLHNNASTPPALRIGLVNRVKNRRITNLSDIEKRLGQELPDPAMETPLMEDLDFSEQAAWWGSKNVVEIAHGAACTNLVFLPATEGGARAG
eukprot:scaffold3789_cov44-Attheya_sp.AAC.6